MLNKWLVIELLHFDASRHQCRENVLSFGNESVFNRTIELWWRAYFKLVRVLNKWLVTVLLYFDASCHQCRTTSVLSFGNIMDHCANPSMECTPQIRMMQCKAGKMRKFSLQLWYWDVLGFMNFASFVLYNLKLDSTWCIQFVEKSTELLYSVDKLIFSIT